MPTRHRHRRARADPALTRDNIVAAAIAVADREGLDALSMRRLAGELGVGPMTLYRYVAGKDELVHLMVRAVFAERPLPEPGPNGWRARLELVCRTQWQLYRRHGWLTEVISMTRPMLIPEAMTHTEWTMRALDGLGLDADEHTREAMALPAMVRGLALTVVAEAEAEQATGMTRQQWWVSLEQEVNKILCSGRFPYLARLSGAAADDLDALFELGLARHLDGLTAALTSRCETSAHADG